MKTIRPWLFGPPTNTFFSNELNTDPINYLATFLTDTDKKHLAKSHHACFSLFNSYIQTANKTAWTLGCHVAEGEQDQAEALIKNDPSLLFEEIKITDNYGNFFPKITVFQYALWAYDAHMWTMILKYLDPQIALQQLNDLEMNGTIHGAHTTAIDKLVQAINKYVDYYTNKMDWNYDIPEPVSNELRALWYEVGKVQRSQPVHVINEYCHPHRAFKVNGHPPSFSLDEKLPRSTHTNLFQGEYKDVYPLQNKGLGYNSALTRGDANSAWMLHRSRIDLGDTDMDLAAISHLWEVRQAQLKQLRLDLELAVRSRKTSRCVLF